MPVQEMLEIQRYLKETRPDLRAGSHDWWEAFRKINREGRKDEGQKSRPSSTCSD